METNEIDEIIIEQNRHIKKLHAIVTETIKEEELITNNLLHPPNEILTGGQKLSDKVARFGGSWRFIVIFCVLLAVWIAFNSITLPTSRFDPYPFILMNLILSSIAALQAPIIMMSQNRQEEKDRRRGENDYMINLKAEMEIRSLHQKIDVLLEEQLKTLFDSQAKQMSFLKNIEEKLDKAIGIEKQ